SFGDDIACDHISHAAGGLATDHDCAVRVLEHTVGYGDVFSGPTDSSSINSAPRLENDRVISRIEIRIRYPHLVAGFDIEAVSICAGIGLDDHIANHHVFAIQQMDHPHGGADDMNPLDQNVLAVHWADERWAQAWCGLAKILLRNFSSIFQPVLDADPHGPSLGVIGSAQPGGIIRSESAAAG